MSCFGNEPVIALPRAPCGAGGEDVTLRAPGRPKDLEKREAILNAAQALFAERGIDGAPIEAIAAQSGVSKVTVYAHFGDKARIFEAIVQRETDRLSRELSCGIDDSVTLEERLAQFGAALVGMMTQPCHLALDKAVSLEAQRNPELGRRFFDAGPGHVRGLLAATLREAVARGEVLLPDPDRAAQDLMGLWLGFRAIEKRYCGGVLPDAAALLADIQRTTRLFLRSCAVPA